MAFYRPEAWVTSGYPGDYTCTFKTAFYIESDAGASTQVIISRNWNGSAEGIVFYWDNSADQASGVWFTGGGGTFEQATLASRPAVNDQCIGYLKSSSTAVTVGWALLSNPTSWVSGSTPNPLPAHGADNAMSLTSNANGALMTAQNWCGWNELLSESTLSGEVYSTAVYRTNLVFEIKLTSGSTSGPWADTSGNGNNATSQAGGVNTQTRANFLPDVPSLDYTPGELPKGPRGMRTSRKGFIPKIAAQRWQPRFWPGAAAGAVFADTVAESLTLSDAQTVVATFASSRAESLTLSDSQTVVATFSVSQAESLTLTDSQVANFTSPQTVAESLTLADAQDAVFVIAVDIAEALTLSDSQTAVATFAVSQAESLTLVDSQTATADFVAAQAESLTLTDSQTGIATFVASLAESLTLADSQDATVTSGATYNVNQDESLTLSDTQTATATFVAAQAESLILVDSQVSNLTSPVAVAETLSLADSQDATVNAQTYNVAVEESLTLSDSQDASLQIGQIIDGGVGGEKRAKKRKPLKTAREEIDDLLGDVIAEIRAPKPAIVPAKVQPKVEPQPVVQAPVVPKIKLEPVKLLEVQKEEDDEQVASMLLELFF